MIDNQGARSRVVVSPADRSAIDQIIKKLPINSTWSWIYLGRSVTAGLQLEHWIGSRGERLPFAHLLQTAAVELRQPYIDYVAQLGQEVGTADWWSQALSEKNPYVSQLFFYASCIRACQSLLADRPPEAGPLVVVAESEALRQSLSYNLQSYTGEIDRVELTITTRLIEWPRRLLNLVLNRVKFVIRETEKIFWARFVYRLHHAPALSQALATGRPVSLVYAVVDHRSLKLDSRRFTNTDFAELIKYLESKNQQCINVPNIQPVFPYRAVAAFMANSDIPFLVYHVYLSVLHVLVIAVQTAIKFPRRQQHSLLHGLEVSDLIWHDQIWDWVNSRRAQGLLYYQAIANWKQAGVPVAQYINSFENHIGERVVYAALKRFYPEVKLIAYQPSRLPQFLTNYFISETERDTLPLPDRIVSSGEYTAALLRPSYGTRVVAGGGLRYQYLLARLTENSPNRCSLPAQPTVIVAPAIGLDESLELIWMAYQAFLSEPDITVVLTCHPAIPWERIFKASGICELPPHFLVSRERVGDLLLNQGCHALIYDNSTTALDAIVLGIPVVHVQTAHWLDMDPLSFVPHLRLNANTPVELAACVRQILNARETFVNERKEQWQQAFYSLFGPVTEDVYKLFLLEKNVPNAVEIIRD